MDTRIRIEESVTTPDPIYGSDIVTWSHKCTVWAEVLDVLPTRQLSEQVRQAVQVSTVRTRVRCRYRKDVNASMRVVVGAVVHKIVSGPAEIGRHEFMEMLLERTSS